MSRRPALHLLSASLCGLSLLASAGSHGAEPAKRLAVTDVPADSEFWELYDELADDDGHLPAPEEVPPPKESLMPAPNTEGAKEEL